jgi:hypothetical protein
MGLSLSLWAIELENIMGMDTIDDWDMVINGCINQMMEYPHREIRTRKIAEKARKGIELTCQEKIILVIEAQQYVREIVKIYNEKDEKRIRKDTIAWLMVEEDDRLKELLDKKKRTRKETAELQVYRMKLTLLLVLFFPECYTHE